MSPSVPERIAPVAPSLVVVAGVLLPWVRVSPAHEGPVISIYHSGMGSGLELPHGLVLVPTVLLLSALSLAGYRYRRGELVVGAVGALAVGWFIQSWQGTFIAGPGTWVTLAGCLFLTAVAAIGLYRRRKRVKSTA
ncbi:hypothetical protein E6P09_13145 [Haloferax mediterranei ATCC 33500]|uniref:Uncharacterized protein n=1 Tax=Haloferax mediterranei (strain ATCC 33500 / DSM 1411 / JCM 8866 / NBRC 14739 / NCIMB 2177 / R-4) TaxID=523841 RepID=A0A059TXI0_HALMT|nr:hypothetical protein [Haloferax mediterranei]AHZ23768.1 hypothetical protein BM92_14445 [Haloferax mediterranei ATCC 33500]MDX5986840.1 hypothetical protein [Haloferax mediterranei ATCC 33500]QCQ76164.1 hypothetical protein E6P09_13145 [Haloferax mediterranei ATCC 33500]